MMVQCIEPGDFHNICDELAKRDVDLKYILDRYGYPPFWARDNTFESLLHIILEQQVSLASALATLNKLKDKIELITPERLLKLSNEDLKDCYFSRQKAVYVRDLAEKLVDGTLCLEALALMDATEVRQQLKLVKGIGDWTVDIYLMCVLHHPDVFPLGDLAVVNAFKQLKNLDSTANRADLLPLCAHWQPYRTVAVMMLWHFYLEQRKRR